jgi:hypothetical protein
MGMPPFKYTDGIYIVIIAQKIEKVNIPNCEEFLRIGLPAKENRPQRES